MLFKVLLIVVTVPSFLLAGEQHFSNFGGVDNFHDSMLIDDNDSQRAKNVITDEGDLRTIPGNILYSLVGVSSISFLGEFIDSTGEHNLISKSGVNIYSGTTLIQVQTADRDIDMATAFNTAFFVDGSSSGNFWYDGTSTGTSTGFEDCKYIEYYENRLVCISMSTDAAKIKFSAYNSSTSWATTSSKDSGEVKYFDKDDGFGISCAKSTPFGLFLGKGRSIQILKGSDNEQFHQVSLSGDIGCVEDRLVQLVDGEVVWLSQDGFYAYNGSSYRPISLDIRGTTKYVKQSLSGDSSLTVNTQIGWQAGASTGPVWDFGITPGSAKVQTYKSSVLTQGATYWPYTLIGSYIGFDNTDIPVSVDRATDTWTPHFIQVRGGLDLGGNEYRGMGTGTDVCNADSHLGGKIYSANSPFDTNLAMSSSAFTTPALRDTAYHSTASYELLNDADGVMVSSGILPWTAYTSVLVEDFVENRIGSATLTVPHTDIPGTGLIRVRLTTRAGNKFLSPAYGRENGFQIFYAIMVSTDFTSCTGDDVRVPPVLASRMEEWFDFPDYASYTRLYAAQVPRYSQVQDSAITVPHPYTFTINASSVGFNFAHSADSVTWSTVTVPTNAATITGNSFNRYYRYGIIFTSSTAYDYVSTFTSIQFSVFSTSTYYSDVFNISKDITAWKYFTVADTATCATPSFQVRTATYAFADNHPALGWVAQTKNGLITASTNPYIQFSIDGNVPVSSCAYTANSVNIGYTMGSLSPRGGSVVADRRYIASISTVSNTENGVTFIWQKNKKWIPVEGVSYGSLTLFNGKPVAGDGTSTGKIWNIMQDTAYSFDSLPIDSSWITKDFTFGQLNNHKLVDKMWISVENSGLAQFGVAWDANRSGTWVSTATNLTADSFIVKEVDGLFETQYVGRQFRFRFSGSELDKYFRLKLYSIYYTINPLIKD